MSLYLSVCDSLGIKQEAINATDINGIKAIDYAYLRSENELVDLLIKKSNECAQYKI
jgi:hypothetical protein